MLLFIVFVDDAVYSFGIFLELVTLQVLCYTLLVFILFEIAHVHQSTEDTSTEQYLEPPCTAISPGKSWVY